MSRKSVMTILAAGLSGLLPIAPAAAAPVTVEYPSVDCPDTGTDGLQNCIDSVDAGSTVVLTAEIIDEDAAIEKSLILRPTTPSLKPRLRRVGVRSSGSEPTIAVIQDMRFSDSGVVSFVEGSGHSVIFRNIEMVEDQSDLEGIEITAFVPASITIENSVLRRNDEDQNAVINFFTQHASGTVRFRAVGNRITAKGDPNSGGGIELALEGSGKVRADIYNNTISDVASCLCGASAGITVTADDGIKAVVNIVGNTIDHSATDAMGQRNDLTTGHLKLNVFNNIFTRNGFGGIRLETGQPGTLTFRAGYNNYFGNKGSNLFDGQSAGPGNLKLDPRYANPSKRDFRLKADSPLIDKGLTCSPGGIANPDAAGRHRLAGKSVDMGAFERNGPAINGLVMLGDSGPNTLNGTDGRDILCGYGGKDVLRGKAGNDYIDAGPGNDVAIGGPGKDRVLGNKGNDTICTRDGVKGDVADGGPGTDKARTDPDDKRISIEGSGSC